ncbi:DMT family transporter [Amycolatopsis magusensis]|uniref:DMT family transporter n=1 Tax=Amycolatopsis magusensis TaxID=882444 RepID=UPI0024A9DFF6|nr:DMT family transporter [Amycolatopsis magusensis]MDI5981262.1 DMT family transporter [Amycolatopsis magusensis]
MTTTLAPARDRLGIVAGVTTAAIVGGSVPVTGMLDGYPLLLGQALRYGLAGLLLLAWFGLRRRPLSIPKWTDLPALLALAATGMVGFQACLLYAQRYAEPGLVAAVLGGSPLVLAVVAPLLARRQPSAAPIFGAVLAVSGVVVLTGGGATTGTGLVLAVLAMLCEACFTLFAVGLVKRLGPLATSAWSCLAAAAGSALLSSFVESWRLPDARQLGALLVLAVLVTAVAFGIWYFAVSVLGADRAGVLIGVMPVSGLLVAVLLGAQRLELVDLAGVGLVGLGVLIGLRRRVG